MNTKNKLDKYTKCKTLNDFSTIYFNIVKTEKHKMHFIK